MKDEDLYERFDSLRRADAETAPRFSSVLLRAKSATERDELVRSPIARWVAVAASIVIGSLLLFELRRDNMSAPLRRMQQPTITTWRSPTASLLRVSGQSLVSGQSIFSSVFDGIDPAAHSDVE